MMGVCNMDKPKSIEKIEKIRNGEKIKCPRCDTGFISAVGNPQTTYLFRCNNCGISIVERKKLDFSSILK